MTATPSTREPSDPLHRHAARTPRSARASRWLKVIHRRSSIGLTPRERLGDEREHAPEAGVGPTWAAPDEGIDHYPGTALPRGLGVFGLGVRGRPADRLIRGSPRGQH